MVSTLYTPINPRKLRYTRGAMEALKSINLGLDHHKCQNCDENNKFDADAHHKHHSDMHAAEIWNIITHERKTSLRMDNGAGRDTGGDYPLTSNLTAWAKKAMINFRPGYDVCKMVTPFSAQFHAVVEKERKRSSGLHNLDLIEFTYQIALYVGAAILLAADTTADPIKERAAFHSSRAGADEHLAIWCRLLTGLDCDPPIIAMFPIYLMMCQAFTFEPHSTQADYVYALLTGVDWAKGRSLYTDKITAFEKSVRSAVPNLDDIKSGQDRSFWRVAHAYLAAMNDCENVHNLKTPRKAAIDHGIDHNLVIVARALDTIGTAYECSDGTAWLDDVGIDSLIGSAIPNDVMDLHTDILTGETRNTVRLLYPEGLSMAQAMKSMSTVLSGEWCQLFRSHQQARFNNREDGRIAAASPPYSFCRARNRRVFEVLEMYVNKYADKFWDWTWEIYRMAREQVTEAGLEEPLVCALVRSIKQEDLPSSQSSKSIQFFDVYYDMIEDGSVQLKAKQPFGVSEDLAQLVRDIHRLWHVELLSDSREPGWGRRFDAESDRLFGEAGTILESNGNTDDIYKFAIAFGRLSMGLPYIAHHTVDAIIMSFGAI
ncbi:hypothetical protein UA08_08052 [Talaromyces atroroseus]|uniref:Uncharacterized protein n=1 Tax=Talaromyces atroroseus TaxID=1441469 RepID=A0A225AEG7_TALAT|nr:hypothetical protein UA08_08052 [Talaromyces atroroseus]OKL56404.1 hypothetical protein UA08_08052 [Talaromyces atroroseus]